MMEQQLMLQFLTGGAILLLLALGILLILFKNRQTDTDNIFLAPGVAVLLLVLHITILYVTVFHASPVWQQYIVFAISLADLLVAGFAIYLLIVRRKGKSCSTLPDKQKSFCRCLSNEEKPNAEEIHENVPEYPDAETRKAAPTEELASFQKLESLMLNKQLFCNPKISRDEVARELGTNRTYLTRDIKKFTGLTFNEYITELRIKYAAKLLTSTNDKLDTVSSIAGFRSRSTFYRAFSAKLGCTPFEYRQKQGKVTDAKKIPETF